MIAVRLFFFSMVAVSGLASAAGLPRVGAAAPNGEPGLFLFREPVEGFRNDWRGVRVNGHETGQADVFISGEGKTAIFVGVLSINCENGKSFWLTANDQYYSSPQQELEKETAVVPGKVINNAVKVFCGR